MFGSKSQSKFRIVITTSGLWFGYELYDESNNCVSKSVKLYTHKSIATEEAKRARKAADEFGVFETVRPNG